jgi:nucleoid-associated protein YgaU
MAKQAPPPPPPPPPPKKTPPEPPPPESAFTKEIKAKADDMVLKREAAATTERVRNEAAKKLAGIAKGEFAKMKITSYEKVKEAYQEKGMFTVGINPQTYKLGYAPTAKLGKKTQANNEAVAEKVVEFKETLDFELTFDCTGAIPDTKEVKDDLDWLYKNLIQFDGEMHATRYVKIQWGALDFYYGQLKSYNVSYSLFDRSGRPLRAKATLSFERTVSVGKNEAKSPDLTHIREVKAGDTLPAMCNAIYKNPAFYLKVAEANGMANFTNLQPGQRIYFPPLKT